ncbi:serine/threonine-protein kinase gin4 [Trebouxia sp. C0009 RCD-2024]
MQTLRDLHERANLAHLDITESKIMLTPNTRNKWYTLGLFDFGLSQPFVPGKGRNRACLAGVTLLAASPEVLLAHQEWEQHRVELPVVDGAAADVWSAGTLLYTMLTGVDPFTIEDDEQHQPKWHRFRDARRIQYSWSAAVEQAEMEGVPISHPLLDRVRTCSTTPNAAANFFSAILHPKPSARLTSAQALQHPYLRRCVSQMLEAQPTQTPAPVPAQGSCCMSAESHSLACAPLGSRLGSPCSAPKLNLLQSVLSRLFSHKVDPCKVDPGSVDPLSPCFPDYTHASSDAELSADKLLAQFQQSMDQLHQASIKEVYSHPIDILPEDEEETAPPLCQPSLQLCSDDAKSFGQPHIKGPQAAGPEASMTCSITADAATHAMLPGTASAPQAGIHGPSSDISIMREPYHAKPDPCRVEHIPKRKRKSWVQRCGGALGKLGNAHALPTVAAAAAGLCLAVSSRSCSV